MNKLAYIFIGFLFFIIINGLSAQFQFEYTGPDTIFVDENCEGVLDWGHPNTPTVTSTIGANIDSFYIYNISDGYEVNEILGAGINVTVTYRATDDQGNADFFTFDIDFVDTIRPNIIQPPADESHTCETPEDTINQALESWYNHHGGMVAQDNCDSVVYTADMTLQEVITAFNLSINENCGNTRSVEVRFSAEDQYGNTAQDTFGARFFTYDNTKPAALQDPQALDIVCNELADSILEAWLDDRGGARVSDNCTDSSEIIWHFLWTDNHGGSGYELVGDKPYSLKAKQYCDYHVDLNFIAEDACGNKKAFFTSFDSHDDSAPEFSALPADTTISCSEALPVPDITAYDDCKGELVVLYSEVSSQGDNVDSCDYYDYTVIQNWEADDGCGNVIRHSRTVSVIDTIAPSFDIAEQVTVGCTDVDNLNITGEPQNINENCSQHITISHEDQKIGSGCNYHILRTWTLTDACGNSFSKTQDITVTDTVFPVVVHKPSDITLACDDNVVFEETFNQWILDRGGAIISDNCNKVYSFAAKPGSYTPGIPGTFPGTAVYFDMPDTLLCENDTVLYYKDVDFVFYDRCFNTLTFTRRFAIVDVIKPVIDVCPGDTVITLEPDACDVDFLAVMPAAADNCAGKTIEVTKHISQPITSDVQGSETTPVNTVVLDIGPFDANDTGIEALSQLRLFFNNLDADDNTEYFLIQGENGEVLDTTGHTAEQCEDLVMDISSKITLDQFKSWITDGYLTLTLVPNIPPGSGRFAINDICGGSTVSVDLVYQRSNPNQLRYFLKVDNGDFYNIKNPVSAVKLSEGEHTLTYTVKDCANNTDNCVQNVFVKDIQAPQITCPGDIKTVLPDDSCHITLDLPAAFDVVDNCSEAYHHKITMPDSPAKALLNFSYNEAVGAFTVNSKVFLFENINNSNLIVEPVLTVKITGDIDDPGEYFEILTEEGNVIATTSNTVSGVIAGDCNSPSFVTIPLDTAGINRWADDGIITFTARPVVNGDGINPCDTSLVHNDGDTDGNSKMLMTLEFKQYPVSYFITGATGVNTTAFASGDVPPLIDFQKGMSVVNYIIEDASSNKDTCTFRVEVEDVQPPVAVCSNFGVLYVNPNGLDTTLLDPYELAQYSYDNCTIDTMFAEPEGFDCSAGGTTQTVKIFVRDSEGLMDSCTVNVKINVAPLHPSFQSGVCLNDTLRLFANLPDAPPGTWTVEWTGPRNFSSNLENPIRPNADATYSGTYTVTATGANGCTTSGSIEVVIEDLSQPEMILNKDELCVGEEILLETNSYSGNVRYFWYEGSYPSGTVIDSTTAPNITLTPGAGEHYYYVIVKSRNCTSLASLSKLVKVYEQPVASVEENFITLCEGEDLMLRTTTAGHGYEYHWTGPNGFESSIANPPVVTDITPANQGTYYLVVSNGVCSDTAKVEVVVLDKPVTPHIESDTVFCENSTIILTVNNITDADNYIWILNGMQFTAQNSNTLIIDDAKIQFAGEWTVLVQSEGCLSDTSETVHIAIEEYYNVTADNDGPVCQGDSIRLLAPPLPGATYRWTGPNGFVSDTPNPVIITGQSGEYHLTLVTKAGCTYHASTYVEIKERPVITAISNDAPLCLTGDECVGFYPSVFPNKPGYKYYWTGPNGFISGDSIARICNFDTSYNGIYFLVVEDDFCRSDTSVTVVESRMIPQKPLLSARDIVVCEGDSIVLNVEGEYGDNAVFTWITNPGAKEYKSKNPRFIIPDAKMNNSGKYYVYVEQNGCTSIYSEPLEIEIVPRPNQPFISGTDKVCEGEHIRLSAPYVKDAVYEWSGPGFHSTMQNVDIFPARVGNTGIYTVKVIVDGCESLLSPAFSVEVVPKPAIPVIQSQDTAYCTGNGNDFIRLCLQDVAGGTEYSWYLNGSPVRFLGKSTERCFEIGDFQYFKDGENDIFVVAEKDGCQSDYSPVLKLNISKTPDRQADAGEDLYICDPDEAVLNAFADPEGRWISLNDEVVLENYKKAKTKVFNIQRGNNIFVWTLSHGVCENYSSDTVTVFLEYIPQVVNDAYETPYNTPLDFDPRENDINTEDTEITINSTGNIHGTVEENDNGQFTYTPEPGFIGTIELKYKLVKEHCPDNYDQGSIFIKVGDKDDCFGVNVITPNGDGINDRLIFPCLESGAYPSNELIVFNQWGDQVFKKYNYKNDWSGTYNGKDLPVGTYYYVLFLDKNKKRSNKGFFVIQR